MRAALVGRDGMQSAESLCNTHTKKRLSSVVYPARNTRIEHLKKGISLVVSMSCVTITGKEVIKKY